MRDVYCGLLPRARTLVSTTAHQETADTVQTSTNTSQPLELVSQQRPIAWPVALINSLSDNNGQLNWKLSKVPENCTSIT